MRSAAFLFTKFSENFFRKTSLPQTGVRNNQDLIGIKGRIATGYAGLDLDGTGDPDIPFPFFTQSAEEPLFGRIRCDSG